MACIDIVTPQNFTDTTLPLYGDDPIITAGTLAVVDMTHPASPADPGVPSTGALLPNIAWKEAMKIIGSGDNGTNSATSLRSVFQIGTNWPAIGTLERSSKGGLHAVISSTGANGTGRNVSIRPAQKVVDWILANPTHRYFVSGWFRITRFGESTGRPIGYYANSVPSDTNILVDIGLTTNRVGPPTSKLLGWARTRASYLPSQDPTITGSVLTNGEEIYLSAMVDGLTGTVNVTGAAAQALMSMWCAGQAALGSGTPMPSMIFRRAVLEDATVSGRTFDQINTIERALWTAVCNTVGGRYHGDTYTAPTALRP